MGKFNDIPGHGCSLPLGCVNKMSHQPDMHIVGVMMSIVVCEELSSSISRLLMCSWNSIVPLRSARGTCLNRSCRAFRIDNINSAGASFSCYEQCAKVLRVERYDLGDGQVHAMRCCRRTKVCDQLKWDHLSKTIVPISPDLTSCLYCEEPRSRIVMAMTTAGKNAPMFVQINGAKAVACIKHLWVEQQSS